MASGVSRIRLLLLDHHQWLRELQNSTKCKTLLHSADCLQTWWIDSTVQVPPRVQACLTVKGCLHGYRLPSTGARIASPQCSGASTSAKLHPPRVQVASTGRCLPWECTPRPQDCLHRQLPNEDYPHETAKLPPSQSSSTECKLPHEFLCRTLPPQ
ncbi:hypothetical protein AVEN_241571-1 [Araneus ventricosus]|uniref:Uncharacterized protein n=1 Tax=Araneus ventricosus TaxID=182803 RepID=A0A4Y2H8A1_ARAVE|nr:hypothetical protein AVEN_241571-1 [Araneus ventricosus]